MDLPPTKKAKLSNGINLDVDMNDLAIYNENTCEAKEEKNPTVIAKKIFESMGKYWAKNRESEDWIIEIEGTDFSTHSFVLLSHSKLFQSWYNTNNEEKKGMKIRLRNISASTFQLVLDILSTGDNLLTADNIKDVWKAACQLQINVLVQICEDFVLAQLTLKNVAMYKSYTDNLHSQRVRLGILYFIMRHFSALSNTEVVLNLSMEDLKQVVERDDLVIESEDIVLQAIYTWVMSNEHERKKYTADLLQCTRYCLTSSSCISKLEQHPITLNDSRVKEIFKRAIAFNVGLCSYISGFWPTPAVYRESWGFEHVCVYFNTAAEKFIHLSLKKNSLINFSDSPPLNAIKLAVVYGSLVVFKETKGNIEIFTHAMKMWLSVCSFKPEAGDTCLFVITHKSSIFAFSRNKMYHFDSNNWDTKCQEIPFNIVSPVHAISFYNHILVFSDVDKNWLEETTVHVWSTETKTLNYLNRLRFTARNMTSFKDDRHAYIIDQHGHFWKLTNSGTIVFTYIGKLWDETACLTGALLFMKSLYVFVARLPSLNGLNVKLDQAGGVFNDFKLHITGAFTSNVVIF